MPSSAVRLTRRPEEVTAWAAAATSSGPDCTPGYCEHCQCSCACLCECDQFQPLSGSHPPVRMTSEPQDPQPVVDKGRGGLYHRR